ncbi:hypothetical protein B0H14DRAFT_3657618 [Mycena olivaceomarginata]|nr:hypothetical protein B0H14DRAFT_3657618 [Mycena olivaceomarginata]
MLFLLLPLPLFLHVASALLNVTIDDTDPAIVYSGTWEPSADSAASATLTFTGVAVYYVVPRWPYAVSTQLSLDGGPGVVVNLTDPHASTTGDGGSESAAASVAWAATGLTNTTHRLVLTMAPTGNVIVADGFIYTVNNGSSPASSSSASPSSSSSSSSSHAPSSSSTAGADSAQTSTVPSKKNDTLAITIGTALGAAALLAALLAAFFLLFRRRKQERQQRRRKTDLIGDEWQDEWGPHARPTPFLAGVGAGVGGQQRASRHEPSMSDASTGPLLAARASYAGGGVGDAGAEAGAEMGYRDHPARRAASASASYSYYSASGSGASASASASGSGLPPGAAAADPYGDEGSEFASGSGSIARTVSSAGLGYLGAAAGSSSLAPAASLARPTRREKAVPMREEVYTPAPPAYSES